MILLLLLLFVDRVIEKKKSLGTISGFLTVQADKL